MARATVFPVAGPWTGHLGIVPRPRGGDWLADEAIAWRDAGINMVVSLLEPEEAAHLDLETEASAVASSGLPSAKGGASSFIAVRASGDRA